MARIYSLYFPHDQNQGLLFHRPLVLSSLHAFLSLWHAFRSRLQQSLKLFCWTASKSQVRARPPASQFPAVLRRDPFCRRLQKPAFLICSALSTSFLQKHEKLQSSESPPPLGALTPDSLLFSLDFACVFLRSGFVEKLIDALLMCIKPGVIFSDGF